MVEKNTEEKEVKAKKPAAKKAAPKAKAESAGTKKPAKTAKKTAVAGKEATAYGRLLKASPRKLNLVAGLIRGKKADKALVELSMSKRRSSNDVKKVLMSAIANAENNYNMDIDRLYVSEAYVGRAFALKRFHSRGRGKSASIKKMFANVTVVVREYEEKA